MSANLMQLGQSRARQNDVAPSVMWGYLLCQSSEFAIGLRPATAVQIVPGNSDAFAISQPSQAGSRVERALHSARCQAEFNRKVLPIDIRTAHHIVGQSHPDVLPLRGIRRGQSNRHKLVVGKEGAGSPCRLSA